MRVLYIGGTGEISYACVLESLKQGHEVTILNRGFNEALLPAEVLRLQGDLRDVDVYGALSSKSFDVVCQFLAFTPEAVARDVEQFKGLCGQYVFVSTASAYKKIKNGLITESTPLDNPYWAYSRSKAKCEQRLIAASDFTKTIVRPSHTYRERIPSTVVSGEHLVWRLLHRKPVIVHDEGESLWTLTHATDFARAFVGLLGEAGAFNEIFHITSDHAYSWNRILTCVADALNCPIDICQVPTDKLVEQSPHWEGSLRGDKANSMVFDNSKVKKLLPDWECTTDLSQGITGSLEHLLRKGVMEPESALDRQINQIIELNR